MSQIEVHDGKLLQDQLKPNRLTVSGLASSIGYTRPRLYRLFEKEHIPSDLKKDISEAVGVPVNDLWPYQKTLQNSNAFVVKHTVDTSRQWYTNKYGVRFEPLEGGQWRAHHKKVLVAHAAAAAGWGDAEYMENLPEQTTIVNEISEDNYATFAVVGDCQDDGSKESISQGDHITGRSFSRALWKFKLPYVSLDAKPLKIKAGEKEIDLPEKSKRYKNWIIVDRCKGIRVVVIKDQDVEKGILYCTCRNPDKKNYPDFEVLLDDCAQIFYAVNLKTNF